MWQAFCTTIDALDDATLIVWAVAILFAFTVGRWLLFDDDDK